MPVSAHARRRSLASWWLALPVLLLVGAALLTNAGVDPTPSATGASSDSVAVTATVGSVLDATDACSPTLGQMAITVTLSGFVDEHCPITFGASNDSSVTLRASTPTANFLTGAVFADDAGACAALGTVDEVGIKITAVTAPTTAQGCTAAADGVNNQFRGVPQSPATINVCLSAALGTANTCTLGIGVFETGGDATAGAYTGTLTVDAIG